MSENDKTIQDRLTDIYTWLCEPDSVEEASLEWLMDWMNRRPIAEVAVVAMLMPSVTSAHLLPIENKGGF